VEGFDVTRTVKYAAAGIEKDGYQSKIAKFVPAEVLAAFIPWVATLDPAKPDDQSVLRFAVVAGIIATPIVLAWSARNEPKSKRSEPHFYILAIVAFVTWAIGSQEGVQTWLGVDPRIAGISLGLFVLIVPAIDAAISWGIKQIFPTYGPI
jgi:hypothetical protein